LGEDVAPPPRMLLSVHAGTPPQRTLLAFSTSTILTRARGEPALGHELAREVATAERIDALVSFVTVGGVRALREPLEQHAAAGRPFRLLTTTYTGATEAAAIEMLARLPGAQVRVSYDARRTRLHAKAWLFSRLSGLDTAYVGSANLSQAALFGGHEWTVKASAADLPAVVEKFRGTFETLWNDPEFEAFDPARSDDCARLRAALAHEKGGGHRDTEVSAFFTLMPYPFQLEILERLHAERTLHGRMRNLIVAATGTGKTVVAAFDYRRHIGAGGLRPRLLFLAHREEILTQAMATFRNVLRDGAFGELLASGAEPESYTHLFSSIQSFNTRGSSVGSVQITGSTW
jgi:HKD family nuclease